MKNQLLFTLTLSAIALCGCTPKKKLRYKEQHRYFPEEFTNIHLGMPMADVLRIRINMERQEESAGFREVYKELINRGRIKTVIYYFDADGNKPLYEMQIEFDTVEERDAVVEYRFGKPNHQDSEWMFDSKEGFMIHAWKYKSNLVIAGKIKGTEWEE